MLGVLLAHFRRQGDQCSAVVQRTAISDIAGRQCEEITTPDLDRARPIDSEGALVADVRVKLMLVEKVFHRFFRQFDAQHLVTAFCQPQQIQAFPA
ncbi:hypothetical protein D3C86_1730270 [compost metagenome]